MTRPVRVLQVAPRFLPELGGLETVTLELSRRLSARADLDVTVFGSDRSGRLPRAEPMEGFRVVRRRSWPEHRDYYCCPGLPALVARGGWDLVHFQGVHTLVPVLGMAAAHRAGVPYVLTFHSGGHSSPVRSRLRDTQWRALTPLLRGARRLIAVSRFERRLFQEATRLPPQLFTVIRNGGSLPPVPAGVAPVPGRIVSSGRLERYKGHHRAIAALPAVRAQVPAAHLVILGSGPYEAELRALAARLGVSDAVSIRQVPPADRLAMSTELVRARVLAALSDYEAHPVGVMEALTLGVPVVGFDVAGIADLVQDGLVRGVAPAAPSDEVAALLVAALQAPPDTREPAPTLPTWEGAAEAVASVYADVLGPRPAAAPTS